MPCCDQSVRVRACESVRMRCTTSHVDDHQTLLLELAPDLHPTSSNEADRSNEGREGQGGEGDLVGIDPVLSHEIELRELLRILVFHCDLLRHRRHSALQLPAHAKNSFCLYTGQVRPHTAVRREDLPGRAYDVPTADHATARVSLPGIYLPASLPASRCRWQACVPNGQLPCNARTSSRRGGICCARHVPRLDAQLGGLLLLLGRLLAQLCGGLVQVDGLLADRRGLELALRFVHTLELVLEWRRRLLAWLPWLLRHCEPQARPPRIAARWPCPGPRARAPGGRERRPQQRMREQRVRLRDKVRERERRRGDHHRAPPQSRLRARPGQNSSCHSLMRPPRT